MSATAYPSDLTETQWKLLEPLLPPFEAYLSFDNLVSSGEQILAPLGETSRLNLAS